MNVTLPENKVDKKSIVIYSLIIGICILSIILVIYAQFFDGKTVTKEGNLQGKSGESYEVLKSKFNDLFTNNLQNYDEKYNSKKAESYNELIYTSYAKNENVDKNYNLNVNIPRININNSTINKYNEEIKSTFQTKAEEVLNTKNKKITYTVQYSGYIQDGILSLIIKADLQEGTKVQRTIIKTYNYNLEEGTEVNLKTLLNMENVNESKVQNRVNEELKIAKNNADKIKENGYSVYERDLNSSNYNIENIQNFYFHNGSIYIIFAYGNETSTSEVDIAII
ncbi:MAG: hypothetical protein IKF38_02425 [Clostridia bacterium]|nr:hypothetical protein [Clostridia bacterium]